MMYKCRACLVKCEEDSASSLNLLDKLPTEYFDVTIADALCEISFISITPDPQQPSKICSSCRCRLQDAYLFIKRVQESAAIIQQCPIEYPLPTHPIDDASMLCEVKVKVERDDTFENISEIDSNCLENVKISNIYSATDENCEDPILKSHSIDENKMESEEEYNALCKVLNLFEDSSSDNDESNQEDVVKCVCQNFQKADCTFDETKSTIQEKISNMQDLNNSYITSLLQIAKCKSNIQKKISNMQFFQKNLYIKSLMHVCKCGADSTSRKNSNALEIIIHTLECNDTYIRVSREMFIQVFGLKERTLHLLENLVRLKQIHTKMSVNQVSYQNNEQRIFKSTSQNSIQGMDEWERKEFTIKPGTCEDLVPPARRKAVVYERDPQKEEERAKRRKELTRERVRRYRQRKRINAPEKVKQLIMVSEIASPSQPFNTLVQEETVMDEMKDIIKNQLMKKSNDGTNQPEIVRRDL